MKPLLEAVGIVRQHATVSTTIYSDHGDSTGKIDGPFQSMSRKVTCADNASIETLFGIRKQEMYHREKLVGYRELESSISEYIDWYNRVRSKEKLASLSPVEYRTQTSQFSA